ncbi:zinc finger protein 142 isoform X1 [Lepisosteus oculatus]|uniref:zinc finger protein 142 isoform X1 n=2 Tax=Lepisosteus oculatus TaxID=7918 RepID=UPI0035F501A7
MESRRSLFLCGQEEEHNPLQCPPKACLLEPAGTALGNSSVQNIHCAIDTALLLEKSGSTTTTEITEVSVETEGLYHCEKCTQNFPDSNLFSSHPCLVPICSRIAEPLTTVEWAETTQSETFKCPQCGEAFPRPSALKKHYRAHRDEPSKPVSCSEPGCGFATQDRQQYQKHLRSVHSLQLVPCAFRSCRLAFSTLEEMEAHRRGHFPFHCTRCDFVTTSAKQLGEHSRGHKPSSPAVEEEKSDHTEDLPVQEMEANLSEAGQDVPEKSTRSLDKVTSSTEGEAEKEVEGEGQQSQNKGAAENEKEPGDMTVPTTDSKDRHFKGHIAKGMEHLYRTHICPECRRCFKKRTHLLEHLHLHFPDPSLQCPNCQHYFTSKSKLRIHMQREAGEKLHRCHLCVYSAVERNSLRRHLASVHGEEVDDNFYSDVYPCPTCGKTFRLSQALKAHMKSHHTSSEVQALVCFKEGCLFKSVDKKEFQRHAKDTHGVKAVECRHHACSAFFGTKEDMEAHYRTHLAFHCPQCDFSCSNKSNFQRHKRQGHPGSEELRCNFCPFTSFNPVEFGEHVSRLHANEKIHHCSQCSFVTAHKRVLGRHMLLHTGEKPHKCKLCDFRCRDETYLSKHMLTHSDDKNYMCSECGYVTKWKHYLNVHMRKHAGDLRYQCNQCSYRCHRADQLSSHKLRHQEKSLICEVCAFACKRKYELRKHMRIKHSQEGDYQLPLFQCKYCSYHTHYRQALFNHENCKHTRHREFRCALCSYCTFSSTSLFLHKKKVHGYVPGDKEWLENYAQREKENNTADVQQNGCEKQTISSDPVLSERNIVTPEVPASIERDSNHQLGSSGLPAMQGISDDGCDFENTSKTPSDILNQCSQATPTITGSEQLCLEGYIHASQEKSPNVTQNDCQEVSITDICENQRVIVDEEECCTLVLTHISSIENVTSEKTLVDPKLSSIEGIRAPLCNRLNEAEEDMVLADCEEQSDTEESAVPPKELTGLRESGDRLEQGRTVDGTIHAILNGHISERKEKGGLLSEPKGREKLEVSQSESILKALRKQDKDQAEALVLEGRVQMLVVQTKASVFRCDKCSYVTCKQTSLNQHCRSSCRSRKAVLKCRDCGVVFKQQRGLNTHRLRKCPVILKKNSRFLHPRRTGQLVAKKSEEVSLAKSQGGQPRPAEKEQLERSPDSTSNNMKASHDVEMHSENTRAKEIPSCLSQDHVVSVGTQGNTNMLDGPGIEDRSKALPSEGESISVSTEKQDSALTFLTLPKEIEVSQGYQQEGGKYKCKNCSFTCCRLSTINRHCTACLNRKSATKVLCSPRQQKKLRNLAEVEEDEAGSNADDYEGEEEEEIEKDFRTKIGHRFSCSSCPFVCHQKRALESHCKRGCLKPNEIQCQLCSFVAKSKEALDRHRVIHGKKSLSSAIEGKRPRLQCEFCAFTCKQIRCLNQHVALKHEGVKPYRCHFCDFSTTRRYRLEAHESLHTGVGRLSCELCSQTFGTKSKLRLHRQRVHEKQPTHFCSLCDYSGYSLNDVSRHNLSCHTGELSHACLHCTARFSSETALKQHCHRQHQDPTNLACPQCDFTCHSQATLKSHLLRKHPQLECPTCQVMFETREGLEEHRKTHFTQRCPLCPFAARERQLLVQHLLDEHEEGPPEEKPLKCAACGFSCRHQLVFEQHVRSHGGTRLYKCTDCQYSTRNRQKITWHIRIHTGEKPYHCEQCSYACADPSRLKYHMRTHQEERKYLCPECGYKCKWVNQLKYHMTKHTGAKPYVCEECDYRTNRADALRIHRETRHREVRSFICEKCGKGFKTRFLLKTHQKKHSEERPYVCRVCQRAFRWPAGLRHHYLTHTKQHPFHCLHCSYRAKQKFQVVKHLQRHHPEQPLEQSIGKDPGPHTVPLQQARLGVLEEHLGAATQESEEVQQEPGEGEGDMGR